MQRLRRVLLGVCGMGLIAGIAAAAPRATATNPGTAKPAATADPFPDPAWVKAATRPTPASRPASRPVANVDHVVIISIDGCRPDVLLRNDTKNVRALYTGGAYTFWAKTTAVSITLPSHVSMLTGVNPRKHGIEWNRDMPFFKELYPNVPTIFYYAKRYGYTT